MNVDAWLIHTVTVAPISGRSASGDPTYGSQTTVSARVERGAKLVLDGVKGNVLNDLYVVVSKTQINLSDRVWLPGDDTASSAKARRPLMIKNAPTKDGAFTLYESYFQ